MPIAKPIVVVTLVMTTLLASCTTQLTDEGEKVGLVTAAKASNCVLLGTFTARGSSADDALNIAFNRAAKLGGDGLGVVSVDEVDGDAEIKGAALTCHR